MQPQNYSHPSQVKQPQMTNPSFVIFSSYLYNSRKLINAIKSIVFGAHQVGRICVEAD